MKKRKQYCVRKGMAVVLAAALLLHPQKAVVRASEGVAAQIEAAMTLAGSDLEENSAAIQILLEQCIEQLGEDAPAAAILQSVLLLLDAGTADAGSVTVLLQSAVEMSAGASDSEDMSDVTDSSDSSESSGVVPQETAEDSMQSGQAADTVNDTTGSDQAADTQEIQYSESGLPIYVVDSFITAIVYETILVDVPQSWGSNESGSALTSYSPVNDSGAISPSAGTLTISYFEMMGADETEAFDSYEKNLSDMSVTSGLTSQDTTVASLPARQISFTMTIGSNQFTCETICFAYNQMVYAIELMQGGQTTWDYFPTYEQVVDSARVGTEQTIAEAHAQLENLEEAGDGSQESSSSVASEGVADGQSAETVSGNTDGQNVEAASESVDGQNSETVSGSTDGQNAEAASESVDGQNSETASGSADGQNSEAASESTVGENSTEAAGSMAFATSIEGDLSGFQYEINGHIYQFPTAVSDLSEGDLPLDLTLTLSYDYNTDADMADGRWTELANTECYNFESSMYKEILGVSNMKGYPVSISECVLTALVDTQGSYISVTLAGGLRVGSAESEIFSAFPEFAELSMDGIAAYRGNELLYACKVRDVGCNGYVLIRNDEPYYSALSIICEDGIVREICFECLGSVRADGVFL